MRSAPAEYALFLAEILTAVLAVVLSVAALLVLTRRGRPRPGLRVRSLNRHYDGLARAVRSQLLPHRTLRGELAARRQERLARRAAAGPAGSPRPRVFVLDFHGDLRASQVRALREEVTALLAVGTAQDEVVVRLENPGGVIQDHGLAASQLLRLRRAGLPLTVVVDKVAASGGYLMACVADRIIAAPFAVVGSIGVISELPNFNRLLDRHGIDVEQFKGGELKRTVTMFSATTAQDRERMDAQVAEMHTLFKDFVAAHRPGLDLDAVATGRFWFGTQALELRLVDELLTSDDYLLRARERADVFHLAHGGSPLRHRLATLGARLRAEVGDGPRLAAL